MKRLVRYKLKFESKWLTFSGVMMGIAFFLQALDFFALRQLQSVGLWQFLLLLVVPMVLQALWCVPLRAEPWKRAEPHGVFAALLCLLLIGQAVLSGGAFSIVMASVFYVTAGAVAVLVTFGFIPHRALGLLVFAASTVMRVLVFTLPKLASLGYMSLVEELPPVCMTLGMMLLFAGIRMGED